MFRDYLEYIWLRRGLFGSLVTLGVDKALVIDMNVRKTNATVVCWRFAEYIGYMTLWKVRNIETAILDFFVYIVWKYSNSHTHAHTHTHTHTHTHHLLFSSLFGGSVIFINTFFPQRSWNEFYRSLQWKTLTHFRVWLNLAPVINFQCHSLNLIGLARILIASPQTCKYN